VLLTECPHSLQNRWLRVKRGAQWGGYLVQHAVVEGNQIPGRVKTLLPLLQVGDQLVQALFDEGELILSLESNHDALEGRSIWFRDLELKPRRGQEQSLSEFFQ